LLDLDAVMDKPGFHSLDVGVDIASRLSLALKLSDHIDEEVVGPPFAAFLHRVCYEILRAVKVSGDAQRPKPPKVHICCDFRPSRNVVIPSFDISVFQ